MGILLLTPTGEQFKYMIHLDFKATNNMVEYEVLLFGLSTTLSLGSGNSLSKETPSSLSSKSREIAPAMIRSWLPICSMRASWKRTLRSWTCSTFPVLKMQWLMTCQLRPPLQLLFRMEC